LELSDNCVELWFSCPEEWEAPALSAAIRAGLDVGEITRMEKRRSPEGRRLFAVSHLLVRQALAQHGGRPPGDWRFVEERRGKPAIDPGLRVPGLHFNLSHARGLAVVAVTRLAAVGVDLERTDRRIDARSLIRRFFAPGEAAELEALPPERLQNRFFIHWTLKEAAVKAGGQGLSLPLNTVDFRLAGRSPYRIGFAGTERPDAARGRFAVVEPWHPYLAAVCVDRTTEAPLTIEARRLLPTGATEPLACTPVALSPGVVLANG
jgi:4'-phosphopantetheinyl transferase